MATKKFYVDIDVKGLLNIHATQVSSNETTITTDSSTEVFSISNLSYDAVIVDYVIKNGSSNLRAGILMVVHNGTVVEFTDSSTHDIGDTSSVLFDANLVGNNLIISIENANGYYINMFGRGL